MGKKYNLRHIKATWPYTVQEISERLKVHENTVFRWCKEGLPVDSTQRPWLIRGDDLTRFLSAKQESRQRKCSPSEFICFKCQVQRKPYLGIVDVIIISDSLCKVEAICEMCSAAMNKRQSVKDLGEIRKLFHLQQLEDRRIRERGVSSVNSDKE